MVPKLVRLAPCLLAAGLLAAPAGANPAPAGTNLADGTTASTRPDATGPVGRLAIAEDLLGRSVETRNPVLALAALSLVRAEAPDRTEAFAAVARDLVQGDAALTGLLDDLIGRTTRGPTSASIVRLSGVAPSGRNVEIADTRLTFRGQEVAEVQVSGEGRTDLDLVILDELGNEICRAESALDREYCRWTPRWTGAFTVRIINLGRLDNRFVLVAR